MNNYQYDGKCLALTESFEGLRLTAYPDINGTLTIGYGHVGPDVHEGLTITQAEAEALLKADVAHAAETVNRVVTVPLTQDEFSALVDLTFNIGVGAFEESTMLKDLNAGDYAAASAQFEEWDKAGGKVVGGLLRRREAEERLFVG